jgi:radical SAM superfamily enzyme YgiQ (UPF0313 family)
MKVMLLKPRQPFVVDRGNNFPPLNLLTLGGMLSKINIDVKIIDQQTLGVSKERLIALVRDYRPDAVGITSMTYEISSAFEDADSLKENFPDLPIVLGGSHATSLPERTLRDNPHVDVAVIGEGERVGEALFGALGRKDSITSIAGIAYRNGDSIIVNPRPAAIENLDTLPFPNYDQIDINDYRYRQKGWENRRFMNMVTSRGCPFPCTFCAHAVFGRQVRKHSAEYIVRHMTMLYERYGVRGIGIMDDTFTIDKKRVLDVCDLLGRNKMDLIWFCFASVTTVDEEMLVAMRRAGCVKISYGVESGNREIQRKIRKNLDFDVVKHVFELTKSSGIESLAFFMIGSPGETTATIAESKALARKLNADFINVAVLCPLPGSDIFEEFKERLPADWSRYQITPFKKQPVLQLGELSVDQMQKEMKKFYRDYYLRPSYILSRIRKIRSKEDIAFYVKKALSVSKEWF